MLFRFEYILLKKKCQHISGIFFSKENLQIKGFFKKLFVILYLHIKIFGGMPMAFYDEQNRFQNEPPRETVYHTGNGFYNPYVEPLWKKERRKIRGSGNGIGLASIGYIALALLLGTVYSIIIAFIFPASSIHGEIYVTETVEWLFNLFSYIFTLLIPFLIYALCIKIPAKVAFPFRRAKFDLTLGGIFISLGVGVIASYATSGLQIVLEFFGIGITMPEYEIPETLPAFIIYCLSLTVLPAFIEEIIFRGIVMQSLRRFGDIFALVASSLIFGIFHLNLIQMPYAFILGLCIGYFVMRTGSLWVAVIIHLVNNSVAVVFEVLSPQMSDEVWYISNLGYNLVCIILSVIAFIAILMKYKDMFRFEPSRTILSPGKKALYFITSPAMIIAVIIAFLMTLPYVYIM
ncbi:MAG: CPBP family intramembrane metalloprotease [Ruminococcaceae bacterium]|nr:CPBP family intramembrane metalloprotease [Oscillospiraceae bacterium]